MNYVNIHFIINLLADKFGITDPEIRSTGETGGLAICLKENPNYTYTTIDEIEDVLEHIRPAGVKFEVVSAYSYRYKQLFGIYREKEFQKRYDWKSYPPNTKEIPNRDLDGYLEEEIRELCGIYKRTGKEDIIRQVQCSKKTIKISLNTLKFNYQADIQRFISRNCGEKIECIPESEIPKDEPEKEHYDFVTNSAYPILMGLNHE